MNYKLFAAVALVTLTGCSAQALEPIASSSPSASASMSQEEIDTQFLKIAEDSCNRAWKDGVIESDANDPTQKIIIIPKELAYKDFSGAWVDESGNPQVLYEVELSACLPSYLVSMQQEANQENSGDYEHKIDKIDATHYVWWQRYVDEELVPTTYEVVDGFLVLAKSKDRYQEHMVKDDETSDRVIKITYGPISEADMNLLKQAVDAELASQEENSN